MTSLATAPDAGRAGASYFSPGVRVRRLGPLQPGPQPGDDLPADVMADIQQVQITRVHTGGSQYKVTLGNWFTSTAHDRRGPHRDGEREVQGREHPEWPRYKYNAFDVLGFGQRLRLDLRYWPDQEGGGSDGAARGPNQWVPMIAGPITDMSFAFGTTGATVSITGEDDLSQLKDRRRERHEFEAVPERRLVDQVVALADFPLTRVAEPLVLWPAWAESGDAPAASLKDGQSYLEFLSKLAGDLDLELFVEFADLDDPDAGVELHVEPARSAHSPLQGDREVYQVVRGQNLISFAPTIKLVDQPTSVRVVGRQRDREIPEAVDHSLTSTDPEAAIDGELFADPDVGEPAPVPAADVRAHFFPDRDNPTTLSNQTNLDDARGRHLAGAALRRKARELMVIEATTVGLPRLRPGSYVEVRGMRPPFDGFFYVTKTVHTYDNKGYTTAFTARRPGMPLPPYEER